MNRVGSSTLIVTLALSLSAPIGAQEAARFHGEISDSQCAFNVHSLTKSHEEMLKSKSGAAGHTASTCSMYCIERLGGKFVLVSGKNVYHLDNQDLPRKFVGEKVRLHGVLDAKTDTIHVLDIEAQ
ncbi:MAG TPA: DUF5818 domain-containing protein [Terriglobales bacterium]|nr:DUF5818 domain-containing protein [Terriglobales bacterium]